MPKNWSDTDAQLLRRLREAAGLSSEVLAKRHTLSIAQVRELEGQGTGRFYTEDIKAYAGQRLLQALGNVPSIESSSQPLSPDSAPVEPAPVAPPLDSTPGRLAGDKLALADSTEEAAPPLPFASDEPDAPPRPVLRPSSQTLEVHESPVSKPRLQAASAELAANPTGRGWLAWLVLVALGLLVWLWFQAPTRPASPASPAFSEETAGPPPVAAAEPVPAAATDPAGAQNVPASPVASPPPTGKPEAVAPTKLETRPPPVNGCDLPSSGKLQVYYSPVDTRPASYVYVESRADLLVCIFDGRGTESVFFLPAGQSRNVTGVAPFTVRSSDWGGTRVFFQGALVRPDSLLPSEGLQLLPFSAE